jgi:hypothetical protein
MPTAKGLRIGVLGALAAALLAACSQNDVAIYYFVENEKPIIDHSLPNESTVLGIAKSAADDWFVTLGGSIWRRFSGATNWKTVETPSGQDWTGPLVYFGTALFAGTQNGLFRADPGALDWQKVTDSGDPAVGNDQTVGLFVAGGTLFVCTWNEGSDTYRLFSSSDGANDNFDPAITGSTPGAAVADVAWDGAAFYAVAGSSGYSGALPMTQNAAISALADSNEDFGGIFFDSVTGWYFVSKYERSPAGAGRVYVTQDPAFATVSARDPSDDAVRLTRFAKVDDQVLVGSFEHGFYQATVGAGSVSSLNRIADTTDSDLYAGEVASFYVDGSEVYALTYGSGLWRSTWSGTEWSDWTHE